MGTRPTVHRTASHADPRLETAARLVALTGLALVLLLPGARGETYWLGWTPLWLAGMPLAAWWSLHRFRLPSWPSARNRSSLQPRRRRGAQARRQGPMVVARLPRVAWPSRAA